MKTKSEKQSEKQDMHSPNIEKYFEKILKLLKEISDKLDKTSGGF